MSVIATPNNTLYIANIDWKIKKPILRRALYSLFTRHGKVLDVIALRRDGLRGQAFVIYDSVQAATAALNTVQGFPLFGKELKVQYAKEASDRIAKRDGTYIPKAKRMQLRQEKAAAAAVASSSAEETSNATATDTPAPPAAADAAPPSHILFAQDLPTECNEMMLAMLFRQYAGYKEVRMPREGLAFVEFDNEPHATLALEQLNGFKLTNSDTLKLSYGKS